MMMMMMLITIVLLALLFIIGLSFTLFNFQTNKFIEMIQSFLAETISQYFRNNNPPAVADKKEKKRNAAATHNKVELKSVFATFDKNNDGFITKKELAKSLENIGIHMTEAEVEEMVGKVDSNGDGLIDFDEFCELFESVEGQEEAAGGGGEEEVGGSEGGEGFSDLKGAFDVFDEDRDGLITVEELGLVLSSLGLKEGRRLETCKEMIKQVDMDGDGKVNFDEFKKMMRSGERLIPVS